MVIHYLGDQTFAVKGKLSEILTGRETTVNGIALSGPGEYEIGDVGVRGFPGAYLFSFEGMTLLYVDNPDGLREETISKIEEDIDVVFLPVDREPERLQRAVKMMNDIDPKLTIPTITEVDHPFCKEIGGCPQPVDELKVTAKDLVEGERKVVVLHARTRVRR
jgi:L-ascorbate metabolism protein UlaG (beta-lactamase superfamily)